MMTSDELNRCIDILSELNSQANSTQKRLILELGYTLKQELNYVTEIESSSQTRTKNGKLELKGLLEDNVQLFNENQKLLQANKELKKLVEATIPMVDQKIGIIQEKINKIF